MRCRFSAMHTRFHSALTRCSPRRLNRRNPSTVLIQPLSGQFGRDDLFRLVDLASRVDRFESR